MTISANQRIADRLTYRSLLLAKIESSRRQRALQFMRKLEKDLEQQLRDVDPSDVEGLTWRQKRLLALEQQVGKTVRAGVRRMNADMASDLTDDANEAAKALRSSIRGVLGVDAMTVSLPGSVIESLVDRTMIDGSPASYWWNERVGPNIQRRFMDAVRLGVGEGQSIAEIVRRVRGTKEKNYLDGVLQASRREIEALVRTSTMAVHNEVHERVFKANSDVLRGVQALVTFDDRTTVLCMSRSGAAWDLDSGEPLPDSPRQEPYPGPPPWHFNCRTVLVPVLKSLRQIGGDVGDAMRDLPVGTRATIDGQIAADVPMDDWLRERVTNNDKARAALEDRLGKTKTEAFIDGRIDLAQLTDAEGKTLTLDQLGLRSDTPDTAAADPVVGVGLPDVTPWNPWEDKAVKADEAFGYHGTSLERARSIADEGLTTSKPGDYTDQSAWPDGSTAKRSYWSESPDGTKSFLPEEGTPIVLRAKRDEAGLQQEQGTPDLYARKRVEPDLLEYLDKEKGWRPISELLPDADRKTLLSEVKPEPITPPAPDRLPTMAEGFAARLEKLGSDATSEEVGTALEVELQLAADRADAVANLGRVSKPPLVDFAQLADPAVARDIGSALSEMVDQYPNVLIDRLGHGRRPLQNVVVGDYLANANVTRTGAPPWASYYGTLGRLELNSQWWSTKSGIAAMRTSMRDSIHSGWHVQQQGEDLDYVVRHEFGHALDEAFGWARATSTRKPEDTIPTWVSPDRWNLKREFTERTRSLLWDQGERDAVSGYAVTDVKETIAEAFAWVTGGSPRSQWPELVRQLDDDLFSKVRR